METTLKKVEGITDFEVSLKEQMADIKYNPEKTDTKKIEAGLKSTGFSIAELQEKEQPENKKGDVKKKDES